MTIVSEALEGVVVAHLLGSLDLSAGKQLRESAEIEARTSDLVLDMAKVDFMDSAGLAALVLVIREYKSAGKRCALAAPTPIVAKILKITAMYQLARVEESLEAALRMMKEK